VALGEPGAFLGLTFRWLPGYDIDVKCFRERRPESLDITPVSASMCDVSRAVDHPPGGVADAQGVLDAGSPYRY